MDHQAEHAAPAPEPARPIFEALLYPRRSLGRRGYMILTIGTAVIIGAYAMVFLVLGSCGSPGTIEPISTSARVGGIHPG